MSFSFSNSLAVDANQTNFLYQDDPLILPLEERKVLLETPTHSYFLFTGGDEPLIQTLAKDIAAENPESILVRTLSAYQRMINNGNIIGVQDNKSGRVVGLAAYERMDDESDHGSGPVVYYQGHKVNRDQFHFKTLGLLKEARGQDHTENFYALRIAGFLKSNCKFGVMKSNNKKLIDKYVGFGWLNLEKNPQKDWGLVYESEEAKKGKVVDTLVITRESAADWFKDNKTGLFLKDNVIMNHAVTPAYSQPQLH